MIAYDTLDALEKQVSKFLSEETYTPIISNRYYAHDLEKSLDTKLNDIVKDLEKDHEDLLKEDCESSVADFKAAFCQLQERIASLKAQYEGAIDSIRLKENPVIVEAEVSFCEKISRVFESLIVSLETWATESLSIDEANKNYFTSVAYSPEELKVIYDNLIKGRWIVKSRTSRADFLYYFTGEGPKPYNLIRWLKHATWLSLFVDRIAGDTKKWAKAALIFETQDSKSGKWNAVTRKTLSVSYKDINDADYFPEVIEKVLGLLPESAS